MNSFSTSKALLLSILILLFAFMTQSAWAIDNYTPTKMSTAPTEGPWTFNAVDNGYWGNGWNVWARSFNGMDHSAWNAHSKVNQTTTLRMLHYMHTLI